MTYDPAYMNTAACHSAVTYLDGEKGILRYRGYPIEQLAEHCTFLEVAYLLLKGELPTKDELEAWNARIMRHTMIHENLKKFMDGFHHDAHPMGILLSTVAALSTFYPDGRAVCDPKYREKQIVRLIGKMPTLAAYAYRHRLGRPYIYPDPEYCYTKNYMNMLWKRTEPKYVANPVLARALEVLFILHADHEQNCSTSVMRAVGSSDADPYATTARRMPSGPISCSRKARTSRLRSPTNAITVMSAELLRAIDPNSVLLPTPLPPKMPMRWPRPTGSRLSMARRPVWSGTVMCSRSSGPGAAL